MTRASSIHRRVKSLLENALWFMPGMVCFWYVPVSAWSKAGAHGLLIVLSFVLGAIMIRMMRPFPIATPDGFGRVPDIRNLEKNLLRAMRKMAQVGGVVAGTIVLLIVVSVVEVDGPAAVHDRCWEKVWLACQYWNEVRLVLLYLGKTCSGLLGVSMVFILVTFVGVTRLDFAIVRVQAEGIRRAYEAKNAAQQHDAAVGNSSEGTAKDAGGKA